MLEHRSFLNLPGWPLRNTLMGLLGSALLLSGCNGRARIEATIGGLDLGEAKFAFFGKAEGLGFDLDGNDVNDATATLVVAITDKRSFCRDMENLSIVDNIATLGDAQLLLVNASLLTLDSDKSPLEGGVVIQQSDNIDVELSYQAFADSAVAVTAANTLDDVALTVKRLNFERLVGSLTATLVDGGADVIVAGNFVANHCPGLDSAALTGGLQ
jgi:hypothetical protein